MTRVDKHDLDLHNRLVRELIESDPLLKEYKVEDLAVNEGVTRSPWSSSKRRSRVWSF